MLVGGRVNEAAGSTIDEQKGDAPEAVVVVRGRSVPGRLRLRNVLRLRHRESESRSRSEGVSRLDLHERTRQLSSLSSGSGRGHRSVSCSG
jgi:hypothetical protein